MEPCQGLNLKKLKRIFDIIVSFIGIIILSPLIISISIGIKLHDGGHVYYKAVRVGKNGRLFLMYKFRSMVLNADKIGASSTTLSDPRITPLGQFIRKYKIDEIPQLYNVLYGNMSIVGPRPQVEWAVDLYTETERQVLSVRPGITDYASLNFSNEAEILEGSPDPDKTYMEIIHPQKMLLSLEYINNQSFITDFIIIIKTITKILYKS